MGWPIVELLRAAGANQALRAAHTELGAALDALRGASEPDARFAAYDAVARALVRAADEAPLALVLDDLHWADPTTLALLKLTVRQLARTRALVVATYRPIEARLAPDTLRLLTDLGREGQTLSLVALSEGEVGDLLERGGVAPSWASQVYERTGGNPFFVEQAARWIATAPAREPALPLTDGARAMVSRRLERLSPAARELVDLAAAIGGDVERGLLEEAAGPERARALPETIAHGMLVESALGRIRFTHDIVRETALATSAALAAAHGAIARALERRGGEPAELARHRFACGDPGALDLALEAARHATRRGDDDEAAGLLGRALTALRAEGRAPDAREVALAIERGEASIRAGRVTEGSTQCVEAARLARRIEAPELLARAALAYGSIVRFGRVDPVLVELLEESLAAITDPALSATLEARLAGAMQPSPTPEVPLARARRAIASAREASDPALLARVIDLARPAFRAIDDVDERVALDREALALAESLGDRDHALRAEQRLATSLLDRGDVEAFDHHDARLESVARMAPALRFTAMTVSSARAILTGDFEAAEERMRLAGELHRALPDAAMFVGPVPLPMMRLFLVRARRRTEDHRELGAIELPDSPFRELLGAVVRAHVGDLAGARTALDGVFARGEHIRLNYLPRAVLPELIATLADAPRAQTMLPLVEVLVGRNVLQFGGVCEGAGARLVGLLHRTLGRFEDAARCFEAALAMNIAMGAAPYVHATRLELAELHLLRDPRDARGRAELERAIAGFDALGMSASVVRAIALREGAPRVAPSATSAPWASLRREGEVWTLAHGERAHRLKDAHGLHYLAHLVERPGVAVHVDDLFAIIPREGPSEIGDAGPLLDAAAKQAYRRRLADLRDRLEEAESFGDLGRASAARHEMEQLTTELARAFGLGGRERRASSRSERVRVNLTLRIRAAIKKIAALCPEVGDHLDRSVATGAFCTYDPPPGLRVEP